MPAGSQSAGNRDWRAPLFWIISRLAVFAYRTFPFRGHLPGAIGIIRHEGGFLVIDRNDGHGLSFAGGMSRRREEPLKTLQREVEEETGLKLSSATLLFHYKDDSIFPAEIFVFEAQASGDLHGSWEGEPVVVDLQDLRSRIIRSQQRVVAWLAEGIAQ